MKKSVAVIGLGRFGLSLVSCLDKLNAEIIGIDFDMQAVAKAANQIQHVYFCDATKEEALREVGVQNVDHAIVAIGQNDSTKLVNTIVAVIMLKRIGVEKITVRLDDDSYIDILKTIGATDFIQPVKIACERIAHRIVIDNLVDYFNVAKNYDIFEVKLPEHFEEVAVRDLAEKYKTKMNILLIHRANKTFTPTADEILKPLDDIYIFGEKNSIAKTTAFLTENAD